ncbi:uncharacterized protein AMSG_11294 [Thecamonas trahens ATCC 50062]|uniref:Uncharacterized protein n=1 Tax=Thecamonas trahens ATCC 50062 TaxID=461836 RepID=A0A0L0DUA2_THETB|nr:hypothetical protein AMSG_11294 [Thecamonas trahens ATCC 50062]KNC55850.1 hypothetical protein AMSG_11294 [Thecamonas trahens ATCC 50062]|eukprot:XP_013752776.1 hypothetical protein AMSG_11294 [Thecamonas trahens ATCC 50062]
MSSPPPPSTGASLAQVEAAVAAVAGELGSSSARLAASLASSVEAMAGMSAAMDSMLADALAVRADLRPPLSPTSLPVLAVRLAHTGSALPLPPLAVTVVGRAPSAAGRAPLVTTAADDGSVEIILAPATDPDVESVPVMLDDGVVLAPGKDVVIARPLNIVGGPGQCNVEVVVSWRSPGTGKPQSKAICVGMYLWSQAATIVAGAATVPNTAVEVGVVAAAPLRTLLRIAPLDGLAGSYRAEWEGADELAAVCAQL